MKNTKQLIFNLISLIIGLNLIQAASASQTVPIVPADGIIQHRAELDQGWSKEIR